VARDRETGRSLGVCVSGKPCPLLHCVNGIRIFHDIVPRTRQPVFGRRCTFRHQPHVLEEGEVESDFWPRMPLRLTYAVFDVLAAHRRVFMLLHEYKDVSQKFAVSLHSDLAW